MRHLWICVLLATASIASADIVPAKEWERITPADAYLDATLLHQARDYAIKSEGSGLIVRRGKVVLAWGDTKQRYDLKSTTKSIGMTAVGLAIADKKLDLSDLASKHLPELGKQPEEKDSAEGIAKVTLWHLATQTAGFEKSGGFQKLLFEPGTAWAYSDAGPNYLAECVTLACQRDAAELLFDRIFTPIGITPDDLTWRANSYRPKQINGIARREFGSGVHANVEAMARIGLLYLREGRWGERQLLPKDVVQLVRATPKTVAAVSVHPSKVEDYPNATQHYGLLWWNNNDGTMANVPRDAYWSWGLGDSLIVVIPSLDIVVARAGKAFAGPPHASFGRIEPLIEPIVRAAQKPDANAVKERANAPQGPAAAPQSRTDARQERGDAPQGRSDAPREPTGAPPGPRDAQQDRAAAPRGPASDPQERAGDPPYPPSPVIARVEWAPAESIVRKAKGSDNWPMTWADDDHQYTAYGDGKGFEPFIDKKLSMGLARVEGGPEKFAGVNLRADTLETSGDGKAGKKASGILCVEGVLYLWARNAGNSQLATSKDHGRTWTWRDWTFKTSFGCPTFLNYGKDYAGTRDGYVYVYSFDSDSAYEPADRMVLARVPKDRIGERAAYEFFTNLDADGKPTWSAEIAERGAVFEHKRRCTRGGVTYNAGLKRYFWCQSIPRPGGPDRTDARFKGGLAIYDAAEPWGPWTTVYFNENWDVGPGETASFPTKWMSADGREMHLVFSGDDSFAMRKVVLVPN